MYETKFLYCPKISFAINTLDFQKSVSCPPPDQISDFVPPIKSGQITPKHQQGENICKLFVNGTISEMYCIRTKFFVNFVGWNFSDGTANRFAGW